MDDIKTAVGARPELKWVDVGLIDVDHNYQREIDGRHVDKILRDFRWDHFGAVVLSRKGDRYVVTDGQHRVKAAQLHPQVDQVPALVTGLDTTAEEARNFLVINRARKAVSPVEMHWAGLASGDPEAVRLQAVLAKASCDVCAGPGEYKPGLTNAVSAIRRALEHYGDGAVISALKLIRQTWPDDARALRGVLVTALARIYRANPAFDEARLTRALLPKSFAEMTAHAEGFRKLSGGSADTALARTITELYNRGLSTNTIYFGAGGKAAAQDGPQ